MTRKGINSKSLGSRQGLKIKSGQLLMTKNDERDTMVKVLRPRDAYFGDGIPYKKKHKKS